MKSTESKGPGVVTRVAELISSPRETVYRWSTAVVTKAKVSFDDHIAGQLFIGVASRPA
jgi:hypothetical protein